MSDASNVTTSKPKVGGAISSAPVGTALPTDATTALNVAFKSLGYISEEGLKNENSPESELIKAWGGDTVAVVQTEKADSFSFKLIEAINIDVLKEVYGADNVTGTLASGITIKANAKQLPERAYIIDTILKDGVIKRVVIPKATISEIDEIVYADAEALGYGVKVTALPDTTENTHYEYIKAKPTGGGQ